MGASTSGLNSTEEIAGLVERVTFFNEENGFAVLRVKVRGHQDQVTVLGSVPSISAGEWLTGKGWWVREKEHGLQFKAQTLTATPPTTSEGVERYAITIHKSQGSEFPAVVIPVAMQHFMLLERNLIYTGITRARKFLVVVGQKKALGLAVRNDQSRKRYSGLLSSLKEAARPVID